MAASCRQSVHPKGTVQQPLHWLMKRECQNHSKNVDQIQVENVEEQWHSAKDQQRMKNLLNERARLHSVKVRQKNQRRTESHKQELQRCWIFLDIQECDNRHGPGALWMPRSSTIECNVCGGITVSIERAQTDE